MSLGIPRDYQSSGFEAPRTEALWPLGTTVKHSQRKQEVHADQKFGLMGGELAIMGKDVEDCQGA